jgi:hypothetical protein
MDIPDAALAHRGYLYFLDMPIAAPKNFGNIWRYDIME